MRCGRPASASSRGRRGTHPRSAPTTLPHLPRLLRFTELTESHPFSSRPRTDRKDQVMNPSRSAREYPPGIRPAMHPRWTLRSSGSRRKDNFTLCQPQCTSVTPTLRSALLLGRMAPPFPCRHALPARRLTALGARGASSTGCRPHRSARIAQHLFPLTPLAPRPCRAHPLPLEHPPTRLQVPIVALRSHRTRRPPPTPARARPNDTWRIVRT